jgi:hypothetical protein
MPEALYQEEPEESRKPKLQLEPAGGGPAARGRTALGYEDPAQPLDRRRLPTPPWWTFVKWRVKAYRELFAGFDLRKAMFLLKQFEVPPLYRLGVCLRWGLIDADRDGFSVADFDALLRDDPNLDYPNGYDLKEELDGFELAVIYQLNSRCGDFCKFIGEQNDERFALEWGIAQRE